MTLVDTSVWVEFLRARGQREIKQRVVALIEVGQAAFCGPIEFELLSGADSREIPLLEEAFSFATRLEFDVTCWQGAARLESMLRSKGVTVPRDDVFVAAAAITHNLPLMAMDRHFNQMIERGGAKIQLIDLNPQV